LIKKFNARGSVRVGTQNATIVYKLRSDNFLIKIMMIMMMMLMMMMFTKFSEITQS